MLLCFPYRYLIAALVGIGLIIITCIRHSFVLVITHTLLPVTSRTSNLSIYPHCTVYNSSRDYESHYPHDMSMQFHTVYYIGMALGMVMSGCISQRFPTNIVMGVAFFIYSTLTLVLPLIYVLSSTGVFLIRIVQGTVEGVGQIAMPVIICAWALKQETSTLLAVGFSAFNFSPAVATIVAGACLCYISWDSSLYLFGAAGVIWSAAWAWLSYSAPLECPHLSDEELLLQTTEGHKMSKSSRTLVARTPWKRLLTSKAVWAIWIGCFCKNFVTSTVTALQPQFFKDIFGIRTADIGLLLALPYFMGAVFMFVFSYAADRLITSNLLSTTKVRKLFQCIGAITESVFFVLMIYASNWQMSFAFLTSAYTAGAMTFAGFNCNIADLSPEFSGAVSAITYTGIMGGAASTFIASLVPGKHSTIDNWAVVFWLEAAIAACAAAFFFLFASAEQQPWGVECEVTHTAQESNSATGEEKDLLRNEHISQMTKGKRSLYTGNDTFGIAQEEEQRSS